jgi:hypothetical protein
LNTRPLFPFKAKAFLALGEVEAAIDVVNAFRDRPPGTLSLNVPATVPRLVLSEMLIARIVGHKIETMSVGPYGSGPSLVTKVKAMRKLRYPQ